MKRFNWISKSYYDDENFVCRQEGIAILDGSLKTTFDNGFLELTTHRLIWFDSKDISYRIGIHLKNIKTFKIEKGSFGKPNAIIFYISEDNDELDDTIKNPVSNSSNLYFKFLFKRSGDSDFLNSITETINVKVWTTTKSFNNKNKGILGIERNMKSKAESTDQNIDLAFTDLNNLMSKAKDMVNLCSSISQKIANKGDLSTDETVQFKSYLLSMGISDPVTRNQFSNSQTYADRLARQINDFLMKILPNIGGVISSAEVFCRLNRARGMELLSPEDLIEAGKSMQNLKLPVILKIFDSGVMVFQLASLTDESSKMETVRIVTDHKYVTAEQLSRILLIPKMLCKERLLLCENSGDLCRDDTLEALRFYVNKF